MRQGATEERLDLLLGAAHGGGRGDNLRAHRGAVEITGAERVNRGLVEAGHRAERAGDQVQFVLDDEVGRGEWLAEHLAVLWLRCGVEARGVVAVGTAEQRTAGTHPGQRGELINRGDEEGWQAAVDRLIHRDNRQRAIAAEITRKIATDDAEFAWRVGVGPQAERGGGEARVAPRAALQRDR